MPLHCHHCGSALERVSEGDALCPACLWDSLAGEADPATVHDMELPKVAGHEILEELAQGGMGIVYRARQLDPRREVALKMLLPGDRRRSDLRERFRVEIRALAELDHPDILPLYQVGESEGRPWFSMKLAAGGSLATRLRANPRPHSPEKAAALMADLAEAVQYAHSRGVLHRDVKPGNILFDERGTAFLADFGLAKLVDATEDMTRSGAIMGTPCYMAPEVATEGARAATVASDVYSLGAVLYELLSGRPPFMIEGMAALVRKIVEDEPEHPSTLVDHVPRDLELVCLTCLAKDPKRRYTSAGALADDLRRWLRGEPVAARRAGVTVRLWSWARRRPALAGLSAALVLTLAASTVALALSYRSVQQSYRNVQQSYDREKQARHDADAASDFLIGKFADSLESVGRLDLVEAACEQMEKLRSPDDPAGRKRSAVMNMRWGQVLWARGKSAAAAEKFQLAQSLADGVRAGEEADAEALGLALLARTRRAEVVADSTSFDDAHRLLDEAESILKGATRMPVDVVVRHQAEINRTRAQIITRLREDADGVAAASRATASYRAWQALDSEDPERQLALVASLRLEASTFLNRALSEQKNPAARQSGFEKSFALYREARDLAEAVRSAHPPLLAPAEYEKALSAGGMGIALELLDPSRESEVLEHLELNLRLMEGLVARDSMNWKWQFQLSQAEGTLAQFYLQRGQSDRAKEFASRRRSRLAGIAELNLQVREWRLSEMSDTAEAGNEALKQGEFDQGRKLFGDARRLALQLVKNQPASRTEQDGWRNLTFMIAEAWLAAGEPNEALAVYEEAIAAAMDQAKTKPAGPWWEWTAASLQRRVADIHIARAAEILIAEEKASGRANGAKQTNDPTVPAEDSLRLREARQRALKANQKSLDSRVRLLRERSQRAVEDPGSAANSFLQTERLQLKLELYRDALETAAAALALYVECRDVAGPPSAWAAPLAQVVKECLAAGQPDQANVRALAAQAAEEFFPKELRASLSEAELKLLRELESLGTSPIALPLATP